MSSGLNNLLAMPEKAERRPEAWPHLLHALYSETHKAVQSGSLDRTLCCVREWQAFVDFRGGEQTQHQWRIVCALLTWAQIAVLNGDLAALASLIRQLDSNAEPTSRSSESQDWGQFVREQLYLLAWQSPLSAEVAWDVVATFMDKPRRVTCSESINVLLVINGNGTTAMLTLELLEDPGRGVLYPDPAMLFLSRGEGFLEAEANALAYVRAEALWEGNKGQPDVRWKLVRQDGKPLFYIDGCSAGGAFALGLAKLLAET